MERGSFVVRPITEAEAYWIYDKGQCPFCGATKYYEGPEGGMSMNITCANEECGAVMNISPGFRSYMGEIIHEPKDGRAAKPLPFDAPIIERTKDKYGNEVITRRPYKPAPVVTLSWWKKIWHRMVA